MTRCRVEDPVQSIILGADPGVWRTEDFTAKELAPTVVLVIYRHLMEDDNGGVPTVALRSSIWRHEDGAWRMVHRQSTPPHHILDHVLHALRHLSPVDEGGEHGPMPVGEIDTRHGGNVPAGYDKPVDGGFLESSRSRNG